MSIEFTEAEGRGIQRRFICKELFLYLAVALLLISLAVFLFVMVNEYFKTQRDQERSTEVAVIMDAFARYQKDHDGIFPEGIDDDFSTVQVLGKAKANCDGVCPAFASNYFCFDAHPVLVPEYLTEIPVDPKLPAPASVVGDEAFLSGYYVNKTISGQLMVGSCFAEKERSILVVE